MPFYNDLRPQSDYDKRDYALVFPDMRASEKRRTISNLLRLKAGLEERIPSRKTDENLLIASWNIKEFGHTTQRLNETYFYIAEIIARFDLVAVQEVKSTLKDLDIVMRILGSDWEYLVNDITDGNSGNSERSAYLFNKKRLKLSGLAGELVLWPEITADSKIKQLKRTPYMTGFKSVWKSFVMLNLHLHPGDDEENLTYRQEEVRLLLAALQHKIERMWSQNLILAGDFNLYQGDDDATIAMINAAGFSEVEGLVGLDTNVSQTQAYDRMFVHKNKYFQISRDSQGKENGNVFNPFEFVYIQNEHTQYKQQMISVYEGSKDIENDAEALEKYFLRYWRRNQISDHFPIWFELYTDSSNKFLAAKYAQLSHE
jgi:endonuclease/exonuclease/phosphatase family metal-dependent hydrolase